MVFNDSTLKGYVKCRNGYEEDGLDKLIVRKVLVERGVIRFIDSIDKTIHRHYRTYTGQKHDYTG